MSAPPLAPYAMDVTQSRGRKYPEPEHPYRTAYARDRDRIIHARAFRRLEAKTQVFTTRYSDHFRNRLTHTLEVAQIARTVAGALGLNAELAEALALVHDIGHPPFGHAGEHKLDDLLREHGARFDHNLHALRIVEVFEHSYLAFPGLNLTFEVREGIVKHSRDYRAVEHPDLAEYLLDLRPPLEAQLIDLVDEIAYDTADMDDGFGVELISLEEIQAGVPLFADFYRETDRQHPDAREKLKFNEANKRVLDFLVTDLIETTRKRIADSGVRSVDDVRSAQPPSARSGVKDASGVQIVSRDVASDSIAPTGGAENRIIIPRLAAFSAEARATVAQLKTFLLTELYQDPTIVEDRDSSVDALEELFLYYMHRPEAMPDHFAAEAAADPRAAHLVVCDYIAGMTDNFLLRTHRELIGIK
jgi:dGTPase